MNKDELYMALKEIVRHIHNIAKTKSLELKDCSGSIPDPRLGQSKTGLFLVVNNGVPSVILTPWGKYEFGSEPAGDFSLIDILSKDLGLVLISNKFWAEDTMYGQQFEADLYAVTEWKGRTLPEAVQCSIQKQDWNWSYDFLEEEWRSLRWIYRFFAE